MTLPTTPVELKVGTTSPPSGIDPRTARDSNAHTLLRQIFTPPYVLEKGQTQPLLFAEHLRAGPSADPKRTIYSTRVRGDLVFSDGTPLTAAIAASSLSKTAVVADVADVRAEGDRVVFVLRSPNRSFELLLTQTWCEIVVERGGELLGTGPFMFEKGTTLRTVQSARSVRLVRNPHYRGQVSMDSIVFTVYPPDADGRPTKLIEACARGEVDFTTGITSAEAAKLPLGVVYPNIQSGLSIGYLAFNCEKPGLSNRLIRRAIVLSIDRTAVAKQAFERNPLAFIGRALLPASIDSEERDLFPANAGAAQRHFDEAGTKPARLSLLIPWQPRPYAPNPLLMGREIKRQIEALGIGVDIIEPKGSEDYYPRLASGQYDMVLSGWIPDTPDPSDTYESLLSSRMMPRPGGHAADAYNVSRISKPELDEAIAQYRQDPTPERKHRIEAIVQEEAPLMPLTKGQAVIVLSRRVRGFVPAADGVYSFEPLEISR